MPTNFLYYTCNKYLCWNEKKCSKVQYDLTLFRKCSHPNTNEKKCSDFMFFTYVSEKMSHPGGTWPCSVDRTMEWLDVLGIIFVFVSFIYLYYTNDLTWRELDVDWLGVASGTSGGSCLLCPIDVSYWLVPQRRYSEGMRCRYILARVFNARRTYTSSWVTPPKIYEVCDRHRSNKILMTCVYVRFTLGWVCKLHICFKAIRETYTT